MLLRRRRTKHRFFLSYDRIHDCSISSLFAAQLFWLLKTKWTSENKWEKEIMRRDECSNETRTHPCRTFNELNARNDKNKSILVMLSQYARAILSISPFLTFTHSIKWSLFSFHYFIFENSHSKHFFLGYTQSSSNFIHQFELNQTRLFFTGVLFPHRKSAAIIEK